MADFELIFAVDELPEDTVWSIYEHHDALVASHGALTLLTVTSQGATALAAAKAAAISLEGFPDVRIKRCYEDLVSRIDIAERTDATPQAVGQWIRGERHKNHPFPEPFNLVSGGVWLWGEVNQWLRRTRKTADGIQFPCKEDYAEINKWLNERQARMRLAKATTRTRWQSTHEVTGVRLSHSQKSETFDWSPKRGDAEVAR